MKIPLATPGTSRNIYTSSGIMPSVCPPNDTGIGTCMGQNGPIPGRFNCAACCAFRDAVYWQQGQVVIACD